MSFVIDSSITLAWIYADDAIGNCQWRTSEGILDELGSFDAKNKLSELLTKAERGEEIVITARRRSRGRAGDLAS